MFPKRLTENEVWKTRVVFRPEPQIRGLKAETPGWVNEDFYPAWGWSPAKICQFWQGEAKDEACGLILSIRPATRYGVVGYWARVIFRPGPRGFRHVRFYSEPA